MSDFSQIFPEIKNRWMTEKYDGIRAYWDGEQMYTRTGRLIRIPNLFSSQLPNFPLDGEIW